MTYALAFVFYVNYKYNAKLMGLKQIILLSRFSIVELSGWPSKWSFEDFKILSRATIR